MQRKKKKENSFLFYGIIFVVSAIVAILALAADRDYQQIGGINFNLFRDQDVRKPAAAGSFYPSEANILAGQVQKFLDKADPLQAKGEITALILPHAGYEFSGQTAAYGFKKLVNETIDTVILIGNSHHENFPGVSIFAKGFFKTPLGLIEIDSDLAEKIMAENERFTFKESTHQDEHSLEVQLPFLQEVLKDFRIVPILFGNGASDDWEILSRSISKNVEGKNVLLIASSDLSHYPSFEEASLIDQKTIKGILTGNIDVLEKAVEETMNKKIPGLVTCACGIDAIKTVMAVEKELGSTEIKLLKYANSGQVSEDKSRVVGYASIGFFGQRRGNLLNLSEKQELLRIAKASVESFVKKGKIPEFKVASSALNQNLGAFVTLKKQGNLRGCIGSFSPTDIPLYRVVSQMAVAAATQDSRFEPVTKEELSGLEYEISVLSSLERIESAKEIDLGRDGVQIKEGERSGVFLPQVAVENNWDLETFLGELCYQKAGLNWNCWKDKDVEISVFRAQVFH